MFVKKKKKHLETFCIIEMEVQVEVSAYSTSALSLAL